MTRYGLMMLVFMSFHQRSIVAQNKALVRRLSYRTMVSIIPRSNTEELVLYQCIEKATGELAGIKAAVKSALKSYESRVQNAEQKRKDAEKHADDKIKKLVEKLDDQKENVQELKLQLKEAKEKSNQLKTQIIKLKNESDAPTADGTRRNRSPEAAPSKDPSKWRRDSAHSEDKHAIGRNIDSNSAKPRRERDANHDRSSEEGRGRSNSRSRSRDEKQWYHNRKDSGKANSKGKDCKFFAEDRYQMSDACSYLHRDRHNEDNHADRSGGGSAGMNGAPFVHLLPGKCQWGNKCQERRPR